METDGGTLRLVTPYPHPTREAPLSLAGRAWRAIQLSKTNYTMLEMKAVDPPPDGP